MNRRRWLAGTLGGATVLTASGALWLSGAPATVHLIEDWRAAHDWLDRLERSTAWTRSGWSLPVVLQHLAQSIEYSIDGYPQPKPAWFQASVGGLAAQAFQRAGRMHHDLQEPIPGAPSLEDIGQTEAAARLRAAMLRFERHQGPLQPHFAYGRLGRKAYARAHWMHLADHAQLIAIEKTPNARD